MREQKEMLASHNPKLHSLKIKVLGFNHKRCKTADVCWCKFSFLAVSGPLSREDTQVQGVVAFRSCIEYPRRNLLFTFYGTVLRRRFFGATGVICVEFSKYPWYALVSKYIFGVMYLLVSKYLILQYFLPYSTTLILSTWRLFFFVEQPELILLGTAVVAPFLFPKMYLPWIDVY
jgi:hypothetical protein